MRLFLVASTILVLLVVPFVLFGERFEESFSATSTVDWLRSWGSWAWLAAVVLLSLDLLLPLPATVVFAALGLVYGPWLGGAIGAIGSILSGGIAYGVCRLLGPRAARFLLGDEELQRSRKRFTEFGGWAVALSRCLPLLPEVIACLAGLVRMPVGRFFLSLACGAIPMAYSFATLGAMGAERPALGLGLSLLVPVLLWPIAGRLLALHARNERPD